MALPVPDEKATDSRSPTPDGSVKMENASTDSAIDRNTSEQGPLTTLSLELRAQIYRHALETGDQDEDTGTPILRIGERRILRASTRNARKNLYTTINFNKHHRALLQTCREISAEIRDMIRQPSYYFSSADVLGNFLQDRGGMAAALVLDDNAVNLLCSASKVVLGLNSGDLSRHQLWRISMATPRFFEITFVNEGDADREFSDAVELWGNLKDRFA